jgi:hypothetical protein
MPQMPVIAMVAMAASAAVSAAGTIAAGNAQRATLDNQAAQMNQQAGQERAVAQRNAYAQQKNTEYALSRAQAVAAASGGGADDPTVGKVESDIAGQGEYNSLTALYSGEEKARGLEYGAQNKLLEGESAHDSGVIGGVTTLLSSAAKGASMYSNYGNGGPTPSSGAAAFDNGTYGPSNLPWQNAGGYKPIAYS